MGNVVAILVTVPVPDDGVVVAIISPFGSTARYAPEGVARPVRWRWIAVDDACDKNPSWKVLSPVHVLVVLKRKETAFPVLERGDENVSGDSSPSDDVATAVRRRAEEPMTT